jgi:large subunit ribosomal protein L17
MRHGSKKMKFKDGYDANKMLMRKLATNFLRAGKITTTIAKAKVLKPLIERIVEKTKEKTETNKNILQKLLNDEKLVSDLFTNVGPVLKDKSGGYVRIIRLYQRSNDGALVARLEWAYPVLIKGKELPTEKKITKNEKKVSPKV